MKLARAEDLVAVGDALLGGVELDQVPPRDERPRERIPDRLGHHAARGSEVLGELERRRVVQAPGVDRHQRAVHPAEVLCPPRGSAGDLLGPARTGERRRNQPSLEASPEGVAQRSDRGDALLVQRVRLGSQLLGRPHPGLEGDPGGRLHLRGNLEPLHRRGGEEVAVLPEPSRQPPTADQSPELGQEGVAQQPGGARRRAAEEAHPEGLDPGGARRPEAVHVGAVEAPLEVEVRAVEGGDVPLRAVVEHVEGEEAILSPAVVDPAAEDEGMRVRDSGTDGELQPTCPCERHEAGQRVAEMGQARP